jgi:N-acetylneuraminate lyase
VDGVVTDSFRARGLFSALVTPMHSDESVNFDALKRLVRAELEDGVEGFYCCGSSGEGLLLTLEEREKVLEATLDAAGGSAPVIAHVGTIRTADAIRLALRARSAGAAAVSMIPPYYYRFSLEEIVEYYEAVVRAVPDFPVIVYNIPQFTGVSFDKNNAARLLAQPCVIGVKHTSQDLYGLERMRDAYPEKVFFNGFDEQFLPALSMGATSTIGTTVNLFAPIFLDIRAAYLRSDMKRALASQRTLNGFVEEMVRVGIFSAVKYLWKLRGLDLGACRAPFKPLSEADQRALDALYAQFRQTRS